MDHKSGEHVAIKLVKNLEEDLQQIEVEKDVLKLLSAQGNHIIKLYDTFQFRGFTCFVTELMSVDLYSYLTHRYMHGIPRSLCKVMLRQIACAIKSVHDEGFAHCDIKPENIMLLSHSSIKPSLKLIDFGCVCRNRKPKFSIVQSLYYRAPEVVFGFRYGVEIDVWSFGCMVFEMLTGVPLFPANDERELVQLHTQLLGLPPPELVSKSRVMPNFFDIRKCEAVNREEQKSRTKSRLIKMIGEDNNDFADLIMDCLEWHPLARVTMSQVNYYPCLSE